MPYRDRNRPIVHEQYAGVVGTSLLGACRRSKGYYRLDGLTGYSVTASLGICVPLPIQSDAMQKASNEPGHAFFEACPVLPGKIKKDDRVVYGV